MTVAPPLCSVAWSEEPEIDSANAHDLGRNFYGENEEARECRTEQPLLFLHEAVKWLNSLSSSGTSHPELHRQYGATGCNASTLVYQLAMILEWLNPNKVSCRFALHPQEHRSEGTRLTVLLFLDKSHYSGELEDAVSGPVVENYWFEICLQAPKA